MDSKTTSANGEDGKPEVAKELDIYRDTPIRLLGYANEVGEAFRSLVPVSWVRFSYAVATTYVLADTVDKSLKENETAKSLSVSKEDRVCRVRTIAADTVIWQMLASVVIPGFTINRACALGTVTLARWKPNIPLTRRAKMVTVFGLCLIPFIVRPIDAGVDLLMDSTLRPYIMSKIQDSSKE